jgi:tetratricopeptide (TPR) repeat protein
MAAAILSVWPQVAYADERSTADAAAPSLERTLEEAHRLFFNGQYEDAAALAQSVHAADPQNLSSSELRTSALHFQIKRAFGTPANKEHAWDECTSCQELMRAFTAETNAGRGIARAQLRQNPSNEEALFFLGKLNLNLIWLQLGTLGRRTGWSEYWEARRSLDAVLRLNPQHVRARVARAWIDYAVDTKVPRGSRWLLGGGDKKRGLEVVRDAASADAPPHVHAEAMFALWDMQVRERNLDEAIVTARRLAQSFPDNRDLTRFLEGNTVQASR